MKSVGNSLWKNWMTLWEVTLAFMFGMFLFAILNVVSAGLLITVVTAGVCFAVLASFHYLLWGRGFTWMVIRRRPQRDSSPVDNVTPALDDFVIELNDQERKELMSLLENSTVQPGTDDRNAALRRHLLDKLRMFGA
ncbi:MAG: hypothetical protein HYX68_21250 [Planctomycetes bacterium]|nr:hypothetical protein [Planctomycetota bacterium]